MRYLGLIIFGILILMSVAAGATKVLQVEAEVQFFSDAGLNPLWMLFLGIVQLVGAAMAIAAKTRSIGAAFMAFAFLLSATIIAMTGNFVFAAISVVPAIIAMLFARGKSS